MITRDKMPYDSYWRYLNRDSEPGDGTAVSIWSYPLVVVLARNADDAVALSGGDAAYDQRAFIELCLDSSDAQGRLGIWARPDLLDKILRGDS